MKAKPEIKPDFKGISVHITQTVYDVLEETARISKCSIEDVAEIAITCFSRTCLEQSEYCETDVAAESWSDVLWSRRERFQERPQ